MTTQITKPKKIELQPAHKIGEVVMMGSGYVRRPRCDKKINTQLCDTGDSKKPQK